MPRSRALPWRDWEAKSYEDERYEKRPNEEQMYVAESAAKRSAGSGWESWKTPV